MSVKLDGQSIKCRRNIAENYNRLSRVHERYRQTDDRQTDGRATAYSEREREFRFANSIRNGTDVSVTVCVYLSARNLTVAFLDRFLPKRGTEVTTPKVLMSS